ncbi:MAG: hypothetical protein ABI878_10525 [Acidobacteriota bacterium]
MFVFLRVWDEFVQKDMGMLEMSHNVWPRGEVSAGWEWVGGAGGRDGGTWKWINTSEGVKAELTSNIIKDVVAVMSSPKWNSGLIPPPQPWFAKDGDALFSHNRVRYLKQLGRPNNFLCWNPR